jgi:hypothetical protein
VIKKNISILNLQYFSVTTHTTSNIPAIIMYNQDTMNTPLDSLKFPSCFNYSNIACHFTEALIPQLYTQLNTRI